jgi:3-hydroxyisobutyrate dehydrogenase/2-hydroxy-3-oxopropionate reductase
MGSLMAANLARAGFPMRVYNRTQTVAEKFVADHGGTAAPTLKEMAEGSAFVVSMLADGQALIDAYTRDDGVLQGLAPGTTAIDMGTSGPDAVRAVREKVEAMGSRFLDAPVSGSTPAAKDAQLLVMVGGADPHFEQARPVLEAMGTPVLVGPAGSAAALKLTVNSILYGINEAVAEGVVLAERAGVKPEITLDIITRSAAGAPLVKYRTPQYLNPDEAPVMFTLDLSRKDLGLALEQAAALGVPMPQLERTLEIVDQLVADGEGGRDMGFVVEGARRRSQN